MTPAEGARPWHAITFAGRTEAAAFVAALSRFLASPAGASWRQGQPPARVRAAGNSGRIRIFLSDTALAAAGAAFAPLPAALAGVLPPRDSRVVVDSATPPLGIEQARELLDA